MFGPISQSLHVIMMREELIERFWLAGN